MADIKHVDLNRNTSLVDPNFSGYKLSLESLGVVRTSLEKGPAHTLPSTDMYSFLHAKLFGEHNHLTLDPYNENTVHFISAVGSVYCVEEEGPPKEVWNLPESGLTRSYNPALVFPAANLAVLSDGTGTMYILETGDRKNGHMWKSVFQDAVCGKERPFEVRYGSLKGEGKELEVVLQYVEDREKMDLPELPAQPTNQSAFYNVLEWISFASGEKGWMMERVRRVISHGGFNYVSITGSRLVVSAEKKTVLAFDSLHPAEALKLGEGEKKAEEEPAHFYWRQTNEDIEMWFYILPDITKAQVSVEVKEGRMEARVSGNILLQGNFKDRVEKDTWTWTLDNGKLGVMMTKLTPGAWSCMWGGEGGPKGVEVLEDTMDTVLPHLTTDNPVSTGDPTGEPAFNTQELESVDDTMDENSMLVWQLEAGLQHIASLAGQQHLLTLPQAGDKPPALCIRNDVDGFVWRIDDCSVEHFAVFPALGYIQAGKQSRKFLVAPHTFSYSAICDASRHIYIYRQPKPLEDGGELRNRKTEVKVEGVGVQQVVTLDNNEEILGLQATPLVLFLISQHGLYRIRV